MPLTQGVATSWQAAPNMQALLLTRPRYAYRPTLTASPLQENGSRQYFSGRKIMHVLDRRSRLCSISAGVWRIRVDGGHMDKSSIFVQPILEHAIEATVDDQVDVLLTCTQQSAHLW